MRFLLHTLISSKQTTNDIKKPTLSGLHKYHLVNAIRGNKIKHWHYNRGIVIVAIVFNFEQSHECIGFPMISMYLFCM